MEKIIVFTKRFGVLALTFSLPFFAKAADPGPAQGANNVPYAPIATAKGVLDYVCIVYSWMFFFLIALAVLFIVIGAFKFLTAAGDPEKVKGARNTLLYAAIAVAVALLAWGIPQIVGDFLGASNATNLASC